MYEDGEYYYSATDVFSNCLASTNNTNKKKILNKNRFSDAQVRSLESIFENETKLEPKKKVEVAKQLGLQPRQVAIWFQNKRARFKSKQLELEYSVLRANYNALASQFEILKKEKHSLFLQVQELKQENQGGNTTLVHDEKSKTTTNEKEELERKPALSMDGSNYGPSCILSTSSDDGSSDNNNNNNNENKKSNYFGEEVDEMLRMSSMMEGGDHKSGSVQLGAWDDYSDPDGLFDPDHQQTAVDSCNHWWDSWSNLN